MRRQLNASSPPHHSSRRLPPRWWPRPGTGWKSRAQRSPGSRAGSPSWPTRAVADIDDRLREIEGRLLARRPEHSIDPSLDRMRELTSLLGDPQRAYPVIHITGTNGKTSTARMAQALLRARGLRTGLFTSPHLITMRERICVDGEPVSTERFIDVYREIEPYLDLVDSHQ